MLLLMVEGRGRPKTNPGPPLCADFRECTLYEVG